MSKAVFINEVLGVDMNKIAFINAALEIEKDNESESKELEFNDSSLNDFVKQIFKGRSRRSEFWKKFFISLGIVVLIGFIYGLVMASYFGMHKTSLNLGSLYFNLVGSHLVLFLVLIIFLLVYMLPTIVRRLHDRGMSGWWYLVFLILFRIQYACIDWISSIVFFVIVGCLDGVGDNKYGPNPRYLRRWPSVIKNKNANDSQGDNIKPRLIKLDKLKQDGVISQREYEAQKNKILSEI